MPVTGVKKPPAYLREARSRAGYANRVAASMAVPFSPETIGRHERGDVEMEPEDAILYSEKYRDPSILVRYCSDCPIGKRTGKAVTDRPLPFATLRISRMLDEAQQIADRLEADFESALAFLRELDQTINDMLLLGMRVGMTEAATPAGNG